MAENLNKKTLFICDLDSTITERQLTQAFKEEGYSVTYIKINKSKFPNGLNTAFVSFDTEEDAARALENLNHLTLGKTELCIVYATKRSSGAPFRYDSKKTVFVKGIPNDIETVILIKIFSSMFGEISNLRVMRNDKNESRGYGYITFKNEEDARKAIDYDKDQEMRFEINKKKRVFKFEFYEYTPRESRQENWTNVYVKDYPATWKKEDLEAFAKKTGPVRSVVSNYKEQLDLAYGFSNFESHEDAKRFCELDGKQIYVDTMLPVEGTPEEGRQTFTPYIRQYVPKDVRVDQIQKYKKNGCCVFITDFGSDIKLSDINKEFSQFGRIYSSTIYEKAIHELLPNADHRFPRALVLYDTEESAKDAVKKNGSTVINGKQLQGPIYVESYKFRGGNAFIRNAQKSQTRPANGSRNGYQAYHPRTHNINSYNPGNFFENENKYTGAAINTADVSTQLEAIIREFISKNRPDHIENMPKIMKIFIQMFSPDEILQCIANQSQISEYLSVILAEM